MSAAELWRTSPPQNNLPAGAECKLKGISCTAPSFLQVPLPWTLMQVMSRLDVFFFFKCNLTAQTDQPILALSSKWRQAHLRHHILQVSRIGMGILAPLAFGEGCSYTAKFDQNTIKWILIHTDSTGALMCFRRYFRNSSLRSFLARG